MNPVSVSKHRSVSEFFGVVALFGALAVAGCKAEGPAAAPASTVVAAATTAVSPVPNATVKSLAETDAYTVRLESTGEQSVGRAGHAQLVLVPKPPFHTNAEYPYKFKLDASVGLNLATETVTKEGAQISPERAVFEVTFTPTAVGTHALSGTFAFSVCKDDQCLVEREQLGLPVTVTAAK